jgi:hypothetical protein
MPRATFRRRLGGDGRGVQAPAARAGCGGAAVDDLAVIADRSRPGNARFLAYVPDSGEPVAAIGDLHAVLNQDAAAWRSAPTAVTVERTVLRWLAEAIGCEGFTGSLADGGSSANLIGLAMAREAKAACGRISTASTAAMAAHELFADLAQADSISLDAHKWPCQPLDCSAMPCRDAGAARRAFADTGEYARPCPATPSRLRVLRRIPRAVPPVPGAQAVATARYHGIGQIPRRDPRRSRTRNCWHDSSRPSPR